MGPDPSGCTLEFFDDPGCFLDAAGGLLAAEPLLGSVIATVTTRIAEEVAAGEDSWTEVGAPFDRWWAVVRDDSGDVVGAMMRTAPFAPYPVYTLPLAPDVAVSVARVLHERGESLGGVNGSVPGADLLAREAARLVGARAVRHTGMHLWEATAVEVPQPPPGRMRRATEQEVPLLLGWYDAFQVEADRQAGRPPQTRSGHTASSVRARVRDGSEWVWEDPQGRAVHLSSSSLPAYGVSRIGPVFTPAEHRGSGTASHVVAELTRRGLARGHRMCLFTDVDNPVSNRIYARLGYRPVAETAEWLVVPDREAGGGEVAP